MTKVNTLTFFIAGTMQGSRKGIDVLDQSYRAELRDIITNRYPFCTIYCPYQIMLAKFSADFDILGAKYKSLVDCEPLYYDQYVSVIGSVTQQFNELTEFAGKVDVLIAYLPDHESSMGTAMEMWSAYLNKKIVITISPMKQNLAILSTSTVIVPSISSFEKLLAQGWLDAQFLRGSPNKKV